MNIPTSAYPAIGAVMAAIIAAGISFLVTVLSKDQKTSEFRQAWIDGLRNDLSEFVATVDALTSLYRFKMIEGHSREKLFAFWEGKSDDLRQIGASHHRLLLRLNPKEHQEIIRKLERLMSVMNSYQKVLDEPGVDALIRELVAEGQRVLKAEWRRVKRGELVFFITKYLSLAFFLLAICVAIALVYGYLVITLRV